MSNSLGFQLPGVDGTRVSHGTASILGMGDRKRPVHHMPRVIGKSAGAGIATRDITLVLSLPAWKDAAVCASVNPEIFYPGGGSNGADARKICDNYCPVRAECLADAVEYADRHGIRGGTTANQREPLIEARIAELAELGLKRCEGTCRQIRPLTEFGKSGGTVTSYMHECAGCRDEQWRAEGRTGTEAA